MNNLQLIKSEHFGAVECDVYNDGKELYMTREQIGRALEYANPRESIKNIHSRNRERLEKFSRGYQIDTPSGKQNVTVYNRKGVMEICRWSQQPKADAFMDWAWEVMDNLITRKTKIVTLTEYQRRMLDTREENVRTRKAQILYKLAEKYKDTTYAQILDSYATKELTGTHLLPLPLLGHKTYTAKEIGDRLGISANKVGILTNRHGLKTDEYGAWFNDKAKGHDKEVQSFRYYESVIPALKAIIDEKTA